MSEKKLTHIAGTFLIQADSSFLNGAGLGEGEDQNVTIPKTFRDGKNEVPYVSAQAWKRWLRNTLIEEMKWPASQSKAIGWNPRGNVNKIAPELNPVDFAEDDIFGYMRAEKEQGRRATGEEEEEGEEMARGRTKSVMRASPFIASVLVSLRSTGWRGQDEGFVHLTKYDPQKLGEEETERFLRKMSDKQDKNKSVRERLTTLLGEDFAKKAQTYVDKNELVELRSLLSAKAKENGKEIDFVENPCSPLPYTTRFFNTHLQAVFCLNYSRLGVYWNLGDRIELEETKARRFLQERKVRDVTEEEPFRTLSDDGKIGRVYRLTDSTKSKERASALFRALAVLRGGAKQAQFGTDVSPKVLILAGLTCGNPVFNHLFRDDQEGPILKVDTLREIIGDYADRIVTPVLLGIRSGYLKNEKEVKELNRSKASGTDTANQEEVEIVVTTPLEVGRRIGEYLR